MGDQLVAVDGIPQGSTYTLMDTFECECSAIFISSNEIHSIPLPSKLPSCQRIIMGFEAT